MPVRYLDFSLAYEFADTVVGAVTGRTDLPEIEDFLEPEQETFWDKASRPFKDTLLHELIRNLNYEIVEHTLEDPQLSTDYLSSLFSAADLETPAWLQEEMVDEHIDELNELVVQGIRSVTDATFQLLFSDLTFLAAFQDLVADKVDGEDPAGFEDRFLVSGALRRPTYIPVWLRRAIFYRDRGRCRHCERDLTGIVSVDTDIALDHLRPLAASGTNDPTNFQLLCPECNRVKGAGLEDGPWWTEAYW